MTKKAYRIILIAYFVMFSLSCIADYKISNEQLGMAMCLIVLFNSMREKNG